MDVFNAAKVYKETSIKTADKKTIVIMLYEKTLQHLDEALVLLENHGFQKYDKVNTHITKAQEIILELSASLDKEVFPELCDNLLNLYLYFNKELREANLEKNAARIRPIHDMISTLLESWKESLQVADTTKKEPVVETKLNIQG